VPVKAILCRAERWRIFPNDSLGDRHADLGETFAHGNKGGKVVGVERHVPHGVVRLDAHERAAGLVRLDEDLGPLRFERGISWHIDKKSYKEKGNPSDGIASRCYIHDHDPRWPHSARFLQEKNH